jgi:hypothetical protein
MTEVRLSNLVKLDEASSLKTDLNRGVMGLSRDEESHFHPHVCLNGEEGFSVLKQVRDESNTEFSIAHHVDVSGRRAWLNICFHVYLNGYWHPKDFAMLSPRQTSHIVANLPVDSRTLVLEKVKAWYHGEFLVDLKQGVDAITEQFEGGDLLLKSDNDNHIFDIHGERRMDVPYTECGIVGEHLYWGFLCAGTFFEQGDDLFRKGDELILGARRRQTRAVDDFLSVVNGMRR